MMLRTRCSKTGKNILFVYNQGPEYPHDILKFEEAITESTGVDGYPKKGHLQHFAPGDYRPNPGQCISIASDGTRCMVIDPRIKKEEEPVMPDDKGDK